MRHGSEASFIVALAAGRIHAKSQQEMRAEAARALFSNIGLILSTAEFADAGVKARLGDREDFPLLIITFTGTVIVRVVYGPEGFRFGRKCLESYQAEEFFKEPFVLAFDPVAKMFVTGDPDPWTVPTPGEPVPRRTPEAKLLQALFEAAKIA